MMIMMTMKVVTMVTMGKPVEVDSTACVMEHVAWAYMSESRSAQKLKGAIPCFLS